MKVEILNFTYLEVIFEAIEIDEITKKKSKKVYRYLRRSKRC